MALKCKLCQLLDTPNVVIHVSDYHKIQILSPGAKCSISEAEHSIKLDYLARAETG